MILSSFLPKISREIFAYVIHEHLLYIFSSGGGLCIYVSPERERERALSRFRKFRYMACAQDNIKLRESEDVSEIKCVIYVYYLLVIYRLCVFVVGLQYMVLRI